MNMFLAECLKLSDVNGFYLLLRKKKTYLEISSFEINGSGLMDTEMAVLIHNPEISHSSHQFICVVS